MKRKLESRVAIITGTARGLGVSLAEQFAMDGATLLLVDVNADGLEDVAGKARALGAADVAWTTQDLSREEGGAAIAKLALDRWGRIDILVNNAGGTPPTAALDLEVSDFEAAFHFNVSSAFLLTRRCVPHMVKSGGGAVVNISSALSHMVEPGFVAYGTAKAALSHMTRLLAYEFAPHVRVNALAVGATETDALSFVLTASDELRQQMVALTPMARLGTPEDIACAILYLASPASSWVTGKIFEVDGGTVASNWPIKMPSGL
jgi:7-alpha-hydroxysteroid dehydrogenase